MVVVAVSDQIQDHINSVMQGARARRTSSGGHDYGYDNSVPSFYDYGAQSHWGVWDTPVYDCYDDVAVIGNSSEVAQQRAEAALRAARDRAEKPNFAILGTAAPEETQWQLQEAQSRATNALNAARQRQSEVNIQEALRVAQDRKHVAFSSSGMASRANVATVPGPATTLLTTTPPPKPTMQPVMQQTMPLVTMPLSTNPPPKPKPSSVHEVTSVVEGPPQCVSLFATLPPSSAVAEVKPPPAMAAAAAAAAAKRSEAGLIDQEVLQDRLKQIVSQAQNRSHANLPGGKSVPTETQGISLAKLIRPKKASRMSSASTIRASRMSSLGTQEEELGVSTSGGDTGESESDEEAEGDITEDTATGEMDDVYGELKDVLATCKEVFRDNGAPTHMDTNSGHQLFLTQPLPTGLQQPCASVGNCIPTLAPRKLQAR